MDFLQLNKATNLIFENYKQIIDSKEVNIVNLLYNKKIIKLQLMDEKIIKQEWKIKEAEFYKYFWKKYITIGKKEKSINKHIKNTYKNLKINEILYFKIKNYEIYEERVKKYIIPTIRKHQKYIEEIEEKGNEAFIEQKKSKKTKKYYEVNYLKKQLEKNNSKIGELTDEYIIKLLKIYRPNYVNIDLKEFKEIQSGDISNIHKCKKKIPIDLEYLRRNGKIEIYCPICKSTYILYRNMFNIKYESHKNKDIGLKEKSRLYELGYNLTKCKEERMRILYDIIRTNKMHSQEVIRQLQWFIDFNGENRENARRKWQDDLKDIIIFIVKNNKKVD